MDDLDDMMNDLLAEDKVPVQKKKKPPSAVPFRKRGTAGHVVPDDDFYKSLAADAGTSASDISEADPREMLASMADMDDMDAALFGSKKSVPPKTPPSSTGKSSVKQTGPQSPLQSPRRGGTISKSSNQKKEELDFDSDDPLAGLLSDDETPRKHNKSGVKTKGGELFKTDAYKSATTQPAPKTTTPEKSTSALKSSPFDYDDPLADLLTDDVSPRRPSRSEVNMKAQAKANTMPNNPTNADGDDSSSESRRLEIDRPPTRSGNQKPSSNRDMFDDDDDIMGIIDDAPSTKKTQHTTSVKSEKGRSIVDDLFSTESVSKHLETPGSSGSGGGAKREFVLDKRYMKKEEKSKEFNEDDFNFGGYMPSAVSTPGSRPTSKRSVRFEEEADEAPRSRGGSAGGGRRAGSATPTRGDGLRDSLDSAAEDHSSPTKTRPRSEEGTRNQQEYEKPNTAQSEPVDWLGLSRLGSPSRDSPNDTVDVELSPRRRFSGGRGGIPKEIPDDERNAKMPGDWLGESSHAIKGNKNGTSATKSVENWLATDTAEKDSDWLGIQGEDMSKNNNSTVEVNKKLQSTHTVDDYMALSTQIDDPFTKKTSKSRADERGLDLFSPPATKDLSASFPWETESHGDQRTYQGRTRTPQKAELPQSPKRELKQAATVQRSGTPDSTVGLMDTLNALKQNENQQKQAPYQQKPTSNQLKQNQIKSLPITATEPVASNAQSVVSRVASPGNMGVKITLSTAGMEISTTDGASTPVAGAVVPTSQNEDLNQNQDMLQKQHQMLIEQQHMHEVERLQMQNSHLQSLLSSRNQQSANVLPISEPSSLDRGHVSKEEELRTHIQNVKELDLQALSKNQSMTQDMQGVLNTIAENTRDLNELQTQVHIKHNLNLDERERSARSRDDQLKALHERLERQYRDNEKERSRLQGLLTSMELQLNEQIRSKEEDKWHLRQEESRHKLAQEALEKEKLLATEQLVRDRMEIQKAKDQLLEEQRTAMAQIYDERRQLAQERAAFEMDSKLSTDKAQRENMKHIKMGAEMEGSTRVINDEKMRLAQHDNDIRMDREHLKKERVEFECKQQAFGVEKEKLEVIALQVRQRSKDIEEMCLMAAQAREAGDTLLGEAKRLETEQTHRLQAIQAQLQTLHSKERQVAQERLSLAKERQSIDASAKSLMCVACQSPRFNAAPESMTNEMNLKPGMTFAGASLFASLDPDLKAKVTSLDSVAAEIERDRYIRLWRISAQKDRDFLMEEAMYVNTLHHTPYSGTST